MTLAAFQPETLSIPASGLIPELRSFERWGYHVHGWFKSMDALENRSGVLLVATRIAGADVLVDVQPTDNVRTTFGRLSDSACWRKHATGGLLLGAIYLDQAPDAEKEMTPFLREFLRESAADQIRSLEQPVCGA